MRKAKMAGISLMVAWERVEQRNERILIREKLS
jgi:hypothetical protein